MITVLVVCKLCIKGSLSFLFLCYIAYLVVNTWLVFLSDGNRSAGIILVLLLFKGLSYRLKNFFKHVLNYEGIFLICFLMSLLELLIYKLFYSWVVMDHLSICCYGCRQKVTVTVTYTSLAGFGLA